MDNREYRQIFLAPQRGAKKIQIFKGQIPLEPVRNTGTENRPKQIENALKPTVKRNEREKFAAPAGIQLTRTNQIPLTHHRVQLHNNYTEQNCKPTKARRLVNPAKSSSEAEAAPLGMKKPTICKWNTIWEERDLLCGGCRE